jgi:hypothetical protein
MQSIRFIFSVLFVFAVFSNVFSAEKKIGQITFMIGATGDVKVKHKNQPDWQSAKLKMDIYNADIIQTKTESRCEVKLLEGSVVRIGEKSEFEFSDASVAKNSKKVNAQLKRGKVWSNIAKLTNKQEGFEIKTPTAVCAVRGTIYRINADSSTSCLVYDGQVDVGPASFWKMPTGNTQINQAPTEVPGPTQVPGPYEVKLDEWVRIVQGYQIIVRPDGKFAKSRFDQNRDSQIEWVRWNQQRDQQLGH